MPGTGGGGHHLPADHDVLLSKDGIEAWHAPNYDYPYTYACTECHGETLEGGKGESCYSCHGSVWDEADPAEIGPTISEAEWMDAAGGKLKVKGDHAPAETPLDVINAVTKEVLGSTVTNRRGKWTVVAKRLGTAPCTIAAVANGIEGPALVPEDMPEECEGKPELDLAEYPGGTYNVFHATAGNKVLVAWPSRFCQQGQPAYSFAWDGDDSDIIANDPLKAEELIAKRKAVADLLGIEFVEAEDKSVAIPNDLYLTDLFEVAGSQGSIDFADEGYPQAGVVPFGCVWTARGVLLPGDDPRTEATEETHMVWTKAERLTSGRRDPNRIEVAGVAGAGFVITWQEDPDGLRPGQGEGPGEGWSGAVAHDKTDIWYSFIPWEYFDLVEDPDDPAGEPVNIVDHVLGNPDPLDPENDADGGRPQVYVPMAVPMRMTNNDKCNADEYGPSVLTPSEKKWFSYCNHSDETHGDVAAAYGLQDFCADTVMVPQGRPDPITGEAEEGPICVNAEGLPNIANTASTRPRLSLQGYTRADGTKSAWVVVAAEESKGLGRYAFDFVADPDAGEPCIPDEGQPDEGEETNPNCEADIGKNQWYFSFDMGDPDTSATMTEEYGLVQNLVSQGNLLNQPEVNWRTGEFFPTVNTSRMWDFSGSELNKAYDYDLYNTEIARRASLLVQSIGKAVDSESGLVAIPSWKQGAMRQGGPADTMLRLIRLPEGYAGAECSLNDTVDPEGPVVVESAEYIVRANGNVAFRLTVSGLDGDTTTGIQIRNAVTQEYFGARRFIDDGVYEVEYGINITPPSQWADQVPCAIQAAEGVKVWPHDADADTLAFGKWVPVTNAPANCVGAPPEGCETGTTVAAEDASSLPGIEVNPYAFTNMDCTHPDGSSGWILTDHSNPYYPDGICAAPATNLSSVVPDTCIDSDGGAVIECPKVDFDNETTYGIGDTNPILQGYIQGEGNTMKVLNWHQCPSSGDALDTTEVVDGEGLTYRTCVKEGDEPAEGDRTDLYVNLRDQSWYNPLDVSKGHRGFLDGDFVMFLYAWSPNWRLNAKGNDRYDLYVRRSFDGGNTWTTTPEGGKASDGLPFEGDGTVTCETYRSTENQVPQAAEPHVCYEYPAGGDEQARNVTQHQRMQVTTLDPRYAPTAASIGEGCLDGLGSRRHGLVVLRR